MNKENARKRTTETSFFSTSRFVGTNSFGPGRCSSGTVQGPSAYDTNRRKNSNTATNSNESSRVERTPHPSSQPYTPSHTTAHSPTPLRHQLSRAPPSAPSTPLFPLTPSIPPMFSSPPSLPHPPHPIPIPPVELLPPVLLVSATPFVLSSIPHSRPDAISRRSGNGYGGVGRILSDAMVPERRSGEGRGRRRRPGQLHGSWLCTSDDVSR